MGEQSLAIYVFAWLMVALYKEHFGVLNVDGQICKLVCE